MSGRTIFGPYPSGLSLTNADDNPVSILVTGSIASANGVALLAASNVDWTIASAGKIIGYTVGVSLAGNGTLTNTGSITSSETTGSPGYIYNPIDRSFTPISGGVLMGSGTLSNASSGVIFGYFEGAA